MPGFTRRETLAASLGALIGVPWRSRAMAAPRGGGVVRHRNQRRYTVTHSAVVENGDAALKSLEIWVPIPTDQPEQQIRSLKIEPQVPILRDTGGLGQRFVRPLTVDRLRIDRKTTSPV